MTKASDSALGNSKAAGGGARPTHESYLLEWMCWDVLAGLGANFTGRGPGFAEVRGRAGATVGAPISFSDRVHGWSELRTATSVTYVLAVREGIWPRVTT